MREEIEEEKINRCRHNNKRRKGRTKKKIKNKRKTKHGKKDKRDRERRRWRRVLAKNSTGSFDPSWTQLFQTLLLHHWTFMNFENSLLCFIFCILPERPRAYTGQGILPGWNIGKKRKCYFIINYYSQTITTRRGRIGERKKGRRKRNKNTNAKHNPREQKQNTFFSSDLQKDKDYKDLWHVILDKKNI